MNQKHEVDVCLDLHRGLAVSTFPWQASFGLCQNLGLWHNSVDLPVRPGLWPSRRLNQSLGLLWLLLLLLPILEPQDRMAGGFSTVLSPEGERWHGAWFPGVLSKQQSPLVPGNPTFRNCGGRTHPWGMLSGTCSEGGRTWPNRRERNASRADWEETSPDCFKISGCNSEAKQLSG